MERVGLTNPILIRKLETLANKPHNELVPDNPQLGPTKFSWTAPSMDHQAQLNRIMECSLAIIIITMHK